VPGFSITQSAVLPQFEDLDSADEASKRPLMELNFLLRRH
jgi:hypothetical protein